MKKLEILLNQDYKTFKSGFNIIFEGNLVLLSGVNGTGKSQLANIIDKYDDLIPDANKAIQSHITLDGEEVLRRDVLKKSFKYYISINEIGNAGYNTRKSGVQQVWQNYSNNRLNLADPSLQDFQRSAKEARQILEAAYAEKFDSGLNLKEVESAIYRVEEFTWQVDDVFSSQIANIFFNHANRIAIGEKAAGRIGGRAFDSAVLGDAPWKTLNSVLSLLRINYGFRDDYSVSDTTGELNHIPVLYARRNDGTIDLESPRKLNDLSDGEKAIISLVFAVTSGVTSSHKRIILLDEFDAVFNPSLVEVFFKVLKKYFIDKGILVFIITHSSATLSLAPEYTQFYEMYKDDDSNMGRVFKTSRENYKELRVANKSYFNKIADQKKRITELVKENKFLNAAKLRFETRNKPTIFCEGKTDSAYLKHAKKTLGYTFDAAIDHIGGNSNGGCSRLNNLKDFIQANPGFVTQRIILIYDCDVEKTDKSDEQFNKNLASLYVRRIKLIESNPIQCGIENLFSVETIESLRKNDSSLVEKVVSTREDKNVTTFFIRNNRKVDFQKAICTSAAKKDFKHFDGLLKEISEIVAEEK